MKIIVLSLICVACIIGWLANNIALKGIVRSYINWEWQQLTSKEGMEGVESWRRKG